MIPPSIKLSSFIYKLISGPVLSFSAFSLIPPISILISFPELSILRLAFSEYKLNLPLSTGIPISLGTTKLNSNSPLEIDALPLKIVSPRVVKSRIIGSLFS